MDQELHDFLLQVEDAVLGIQQAANTSIEDVEGISMQAELLLRDVVLVEGILQPSESEVLVEVIVNVVRGINQLLDECRRQHIRGRPQIPISEEQLEALLELQFTNRDIANLLGVSP